LHLSQAGIYEEPTSAALFDLALLAYKLDFSRSSIRSRSTSRSRSRPTKALVARRLPGGRARQRARARCDQGDGAGRSVSFAYQIEEFAYNLRDHLLGLNLGRWDYMASLIDFNFEDPHWVLPDRNTIPHDVGFFQNLPRAHPGGEPPARAARDRRDDGAVSGSQQPRAQRARAQGARRGQAQRVALAVRRRMTGHPDQNADRGGAVPRP